MCERIADHTYRLCGKQETVEGAVVRILGIPFGFTCGCLHMDSNIEWISGKPEGWQVPPRKVSKMESLLEDIKRKDALLRRLQGECFRTSEFYNEIEAEIAGTPQPLLTPDEEDLIAAAAPLQGLPPQRVLDETQPLPSDQEFYDPLTVEEAPPLGTPPGAKRVQFAPSERAKQLEDALSKLETAAFSIKSHAEFSMERSRKGGTTHQEFINEDRENMAAFNQAMNTARALLTKKDGKEDAG